MHFPNESVHRKIFTMEMAVGWGSGSKVGVYSIVAHGAKISLP